MSKKKPARRRATPPRQTPSFETLARAAVAKVTLVPDVTDLLSPQEEAAMIEAYIDQYCLAECKADLRAKAKIDARRDDQSPDIVWIKEEIAFALGVEVGRRLAGDYMTKGGAR